MTTEKSPKVTNKEKVWWDQMYMQYQAKRDVDGMDMAIEGKRLMEDNIRLIQTCAKHDTPTTNKLVNDIIDNSTKIYEMEKDHAPSWKLSQLLYEVKAEVFGKLKIDVIN